ncbi:copper chaperone PCu(A)C [Streptomyces sp. NBC_01210]|uniref:copper chaperone PCu(A)C n=1 Tax=Streptomyces sp. NBC_01210 TaxID=2903774 RepID=UPI002E122743|nr:copper chaperone PCu(A)C [Streptomyces sp. NBC_01210]
MSRRSTLAGVIALSAGLALAGCSSDGAPELKVNGAFMPQPVSDDMAAGFLTVHNSGGTADKLTSVTSDLSDDITIHESKDQRMQEVKTFDVPADGELNLERGGNHIMFMKLKQQPKQGEKVTLELRFEKSGPIKVELPVKEPTYSPKKH